MTQEHYRRRSELTENDGSDIFMPAEKIVWIKWVLKYAVKIKLGRILNGLQVNGGRGVFDREFTKSLIFRDFDDVFKHPFRYMHLFLLLTLLSTNFFENRHALPVTETSKLWCYTPNPH